MRQVVHTWWPLAASWLLMGIELPAVSAVVARLADPEIHLAAYGGVVFPLALVVEAPVIMLLAASTALCRDWSSYRQVRRFMIGLGFTFTFVHVLLAFTPLYDLVAGGLLKTPVPVREPARLGLMIMTPWTGSIAYRRFQQGVLIRFGHSRRVGIGTTVRLSALALVLTAGWLLRTVPGIVVATSAVSAGVLCEAAFAAVAVRPVLKGALRAAPPASPPLTPRAFTAFYTPLALTSILTLVATPIASAAMGRLPRTLDSLAAWPVVNGLIFAARSLGFALNEVVVALLDRPGAIRALRRFARLLALGTTLVILAIAATPLSRFWFERVSALSPRLADLARVALWLALPLPALSVYQSWYQGTIVHSRATRFITESVVVYLGTTAALLVAAIAFGRIVGLYSGLFAVMAGNACQVAWLSFRARGELARMGGAGGEAAGVTAGRGAEAAAAPLPGAAGPFIPPES